jgi:sulfur-oxidizing protein SoxZ
MTPAAQGVLILPKSIQRGAVVMISALVKHPMESGFRRTETGRLIPADLLRSLEVRLNGRLVFLAALDSGLSANPLVSFPLLVREGGLLRAVWRGDGGFEAQAEAMLPG